jgi:hypothetical protein
MLTHEQLDMLETLPGEQDQAAYCKAVQQALATIDAQAEELRLLRPLAAAWPHSAHGAAIAREWREKYGGGAG